MANVYAVKTGNWSDTTVWNTGTLPTAADDVRANGFTVTINQDITVLSIRTDASSPAVAGGGFVVSGSGRIINANVQTGTTTCLTCSTGISWFLNGNILAFAGASISTPSVNLTGAGQNLTIVGNITGSNTNSGVSDAGAINAKVSTTINVTGNITGGTSGYCVGIYTSGGTINVTGNVTGGTATAGTAYGIHITGGTVVTVNGIITGGSTSTGVFNSVGTLQGTCIASGASIAGGGVGVYGAPLYTSIISEGIYTDCPPTSGKVRFKNINPKVTVVKANGTSQVLVEAGASGDFPVQTDVRSGISYASGSLTGSLIVPNPSNVRKGVPTDATVGTADLTAADMWNALTSSMTTAGSIGERLKNASTVQTTGDQLASYIV
jgi:hypothetical protein